MVKFAGIILGDYVLTIRFTEFHESTYLVDDDPAFLALEDIRKPTIGQPPAQIAEIEGFLFGTFPFVFGGPELVTHDLVLHAGLGEGLGLQDENAGYYCDENGHYYWDCEEHIPWQLNIMVWRIAVRAIIQIVLAGTKL